MSKENASPKYPGIPTATDGTHAVVHSETLASEAAGAYPITPATNMGEGWAEAYAAGKTNAFGRRLLFFEPEGEHAAAGVTAGLSMVGLRAANFSAGQGIAYMHESLYAAVGKRLPYILNIAARAITKHSLNIHAGHDDYHAIDDTGFFQVFAKNNQEATDLNLIAHRIAELALNPGVCAMDGFLSSHVIETFNLPERELVAEYLGDPGDIIESPTEAQRIVFGKYRRRIPEIFDYDNPAVLGPVQNQDSYAQGVAAQRPFFFDHIQALADQAMKEYTALTGRPYARASGYRMEDAEYLLAGQGSIVWNMEAVADYMRKAHNVKIGVINLTMFRPFPADLITMLLKGRKAVTVFERLDQPLAVGQPIYREVRAAINMAEENGRSKKQEMPFPGLEAYRTGESPDVYSCSFGMGSRDTQPGDIIAAVQNMLPNGKGRRVFYIGIDFIRKNTKLPSLKKWQEQLTEAYPNLENIALERAENVNLLPNGSLALRMHSIGGWGAITTGKNLAMTLFELVGLTVKANPKYGSEKKGQPTTFYATFAREALRLNCDLSWVDVVLSPDANVFGHSDPFAGMSEGGVFVIQWDDTPEALWNMMPAWAHRTIREKKLRIFHLDGFKIAFEEAPNPDLTYRMQGAAFQGAFFRAAPLMKQEGLDEKTLFDAIRKQLEKKFGHRGPGVVEGNVRVIRRGYDEVRELDWSKMEAGKAADKLKLPVMPRQFNAKKTGTGIADVVRFFDQTGAVYAAGEEPLADPFVAISAIPAATGALRDMTGIRFEVPELIAEKCTGCGQCWTQCPDTAIPGLVTEVETLIETAIDQASSNGHPGESLKQHVRPLADYVRKVLKDRPFKTFAQTLRDAWRLFATDLDLEPPKRAALEEEFEVVVGALADFPITKSKPFFDIPESRDFRSGGLLSVTINPQTCKGCMLCVQVCPDKALVVKKQDPAQIAVLRKNWAFWEKLPDTPDRFVNVSNLDEGIGVLNTLLLKRDIYNAMTGGDGSCMGCGEKTGMHLVLAAVEAGMQPRVKKFVDKLDGLVKKLDAKARIVLASDYDLESLAADGPARVDMEVSSASRERLARITKLLKQLKTLRSHYTEGRGRASCGIANATGCSSVWGSTYPFNPYPYPWVNHLFQDAPSIAIGLFEGTMRKMGDSFAAVRRAELEIDDAYDAEVHEKFFEAFDYEQFTDEEFRLCPPVIAVGGDGAMLDIGFQNLSRLMASGKPLRAVILDTQVYSNTGGQACTSGFYGQVSDLAAYGDAVHGKVEPRKELALIAVAHRTAFVLQASQANPSHLLAGVLKGMGSRHPAIFSIHTPCMPEHGIGDDAAQTQAKLALEARATPLLCYDPALSESVSECIDLEGNPSIEDKWPSYDLAYVDDDGSEKTMTLPMTTADWALSEKRFARHFKKLPPAKWTDDMVPVHEYLLLSKDERAKKTPFLYTLDKNRKLGRVGVADEIIHLTIERAQYWQLLQEMAGVQVPSVMRDAVAGDLEADFDQRMATLKAVHEDALNQLKASYPQMVAQRLSDALLSDPGSVLPGGGAAVPPVSTPPVTPAGGGGAAAKGGNGSSAVAAAPAADEGMGFDPYIESDKCTTCDECTNINNKLFKYNAEKKAFVADPKAGTFQQLVLAAERCPARAIHPGTPLNKKERNLDKWVKRGEAFQ